MTTTQIRREPNFGSRYGAGERPDYLTDEGTAVWMYRKGQRVRFFDVDGEQVGPEHRNVAPAVAFAAWHRWHDPSMPESWSAAVTAEVRRNTTFR